MLGRNASGNLRCEVNGAVATWQCRQHQGTTMGNDLKAFGETVKSLARNPLGIIALFIVMVSASHRSLGRLQDRLLPESECR